MGQSSRNNPNTQGDINRRKKAEELKLEIQKEMAPEIKKRGIKVGQIRITNNGEEVVIMEIPQTLGSKGFEPEGPIKIALLKEVEKAVMEVAEETKFISTQQEEMRKMILRILELEGKIKSIDPFEIQHNIEEIDTNVVQVKPKEYPIYNFINRCNEARNKAREEVQNREFKLRKNNGRK
jgi:hypothetical protein